MNNLKLRDRIESYQSLSDYKLLPRLPLIIVVNGRGFSKLTQLLNKPYCPKFAECMFSTMTRLCTEVEGVLFSYCHNDEIILIVRNDHHVDTMPWYDNRIQKICSITSAIATTHFNQCAERLQLDLTGDAIFTSQIFAVPNIAEAINTLVYKQQQNFHTSIQFSCLYELIKKYDKNAIKGMLSGLSIDEKIDLLHQECQTEFNSYPTSFRRGAACYKVPKLSEGITKHKWYTNTEPPIFTEDQPFISNILKNGMDIFRGE
jgi:tRNA(His) guanylyltransferase